MREVAEASKSVSSTAVLAVYLALTELATDFHSATFKIPISEIGRRAGLAYRATSAALGIIEQAGFIHCQNNFVGSGFLKASNTYTLLRHDPSICQFCISIGKHAEKPAPPISEEETSQEEAEKRPLSSLNCEVESWIQRAESEFPDRSDIRTIAKKFAHHYHGKSSALCYERLADWIRDERSPKYRKAPNLDEEGPVGWREFLSTEYPLSENPHRTEYEKGKWSAVPRDLKITITEGLKRRNSCVTFFTDKTQLVHL